MLLPIGWHSFIECMRIIRVKLVLICKIHIKPKAFENIASHLHIFWIDKKGIDEIMSIFKSTDVVLFQGDSVTDVGRSREDDSCMGNGYPMMISAWHAACYPECHTKFINRGISGNRVKDLQDRINRDFIDINPTWVSILIGINDCWRRYDSNDPISADEFEERYTDLLIMLQQSLGAKIILCEPFLLNVRPGQEEWREDLDPKIAVVRKLAQKYADFLVPLDNIFSDAAQKRTPEFWTPDGVHPTAAGHALIARSLLKTIGVK
jgi:acyl-CoA thioesterase-1